MIPMKDTLSIGISQHGDLNRRPSSAKRLDESTSASSEPDDENVKLMRGTQMVLKELQESTAFFNKTTPKALAEFEKNELCLSKIIGKGEFGEVYSVLSIGDSSRTQGQEATTTTTQDNMLATHDSDLEEHCDDGKTPSSKLSPEELRHFMKTKCLRGGVPRYAVKRARRARSTRSKMTTMAVEDLAAEAKFLMHIDHSNIVKLRATVGTPGSLDFKIVLDQLVCILDKKVEQWKVLDKESKGPFGLSFWGKRERSKYGTEQITVLFDIARAMSYLHKNKIVFRDLKPENIGFDVRGNSKLFDFGLAKELKEKDLVQAPDEYSITGVVGTRRWMAPEVALCKDYGRPVDVYSFCLLFWHVMTKKIPFPSYNAQKHMDKVAIGGKRPQLKKLHISNFLKNTVAEGWGTDAAKRPTMERFCELLQLELRLLISAAKSNDKERPSVIDRSKYLVDLSMSSVAGYRSTKRNSR